MDHNTPPPQAEDPPRSRSRSPASNQNQYRHQSPATRQDDTDKNAALRDREHKFLEEKALHLAKETVYLSRQAELLAEVKISDYRIQLLNAEQELRAAEHERGKAEQELQLLHAELESRRSRREQES